MSVLAGDEKLVDEKFAQHYRMKSNIVEAYERRNLQVGAGWAVMVVVWWR